MTDCGLCKNPNLPVQDESTFCTKHYRQYLDRMLDYEEDPLKILYALKTACQKEIPLTPDDIESIIDLLIDTIESGD